MSQELTSVRIGRACVSSAIILATSLVSLQTAAQTCPRPGTNVQPRLTIPLFRYEPASDSTARSQFELFRSVLGTKLSTLVEEARGTAFGAGAQSSDFPSGLTMYMRAGQALDDTLQDPTSRKQYWEQSNSLELLRGRVWPGAPGKPHFVQSDIYVGELRGSFPRPEVVVRLAVDPDEVSTTNDSHSVVTYFALAMEARRLGCDQAIAKGFLARASSILQDIQRRAGKLSGDLAALGAVIVQELER